MTQRSNNLDYLTARLHGRRSRMAEAQRLAEMCRFRTIPEFARAISLGIDLQTATEVQGRVVQDLVRELADCLPHVTGRGTDLLAWMLARFQLENLKVLLRGVLTGRPYEEAQYHLVTLPKDLTLDWPFLASAGSVGDFAARLPRGPLRHGLRAAFAVLQDQPKPFFYEASMDRGYFQQLLAYVDALAGEDGEAVKPLVCQEIDLFHLMLVTRGKFLYELKPEPLLSLHIAGSKIPRARFEIMLTQADLGAVAEHALGRVLDELPSEATGTGGAAAHPATLEALAWNRYLRLANHAFRRGPIGLGAVVGYVGLRRIEVANLIALSEGIRTGAAEESLRARLTPRTHWEAAHV